MRTFLSVLFLWAVTATAQQFTGPPVKIVGSGGTLPATDCVVLANPAPGAVTYYLPKSAPVGVAIKVVDNTGYAGLNNITVYPPTDGSINGSSTPHTIDIHYGMAAFVSKGNGAFLMDTVGLQPHQVFARSLATITDLVQVDPNAYPYDTFVVAGRTTRPLHDKRVRSRTSRRSPRCRRHGRCGNAC